MEENAQLIDFLNDYLKMKKPQFAVMITGKWGCGKTYFIKEQIEKWSKRRGRDSDDAIVLKPIYVSVNGISSINDVVRKIKTILHPVLYSKGTVLAKQIVLSALQIATKTKVDLDKDGSGEDLKSLLDADGILEVFKSNSSSIKGDRVLVLDDIERCKIPVDELFGFVNGIVEHSDSKVILLCDESRLSDVASKEALFVEYSSFKEKVVGQTFSLDVDYSSLAGAFIDESKNDILRANRELIIELFIASQCENLRIIRRCLIDIIRLFERLPKQLNKKSNFDEFVTNVVAYLTIVSLEERSGNNHIVYYQSFSMSDDGKRASLEIENKYNSILERRHLHYSTYTIPVKDLVGFVRKGLLAIPEEQILECKVLQSRNLKNWEKLWYSYDLSNEEFCRILDCERLRFKNKELSYVYEVVHLAGTLLSLEKRGLLKINRERIVRIAKNNIASINKAYPNDLARIHLSDQGYKFHESDSKEMNDIISYASNLFKSRINYLERQYIRDVWDDLGQDVTRAWLSEKFEQVTPTNRCTYAMESIFTQAQPKVIADKITALSNAAKVEFSHFLTRRYYLKGAGMNGMIGLEMKADKEPLMEIAALLRSRAKRLKLIDKEMTLLLASKMDEAVNKM